MKRKVHPQNLLTNCRKIPEIYPVFYSEHAIFLGMANKSVFASIALVATALLSGCAEGSVPGLTIEKTSGFEENRDFVVIETEVVTGNAEIGEKPQPGTARFFIDQKEFSGNEHSFGAEPTFYRVNADDIHDLSGHVIAVSVYAKTPEETVRCAIKSMGIFEPVESAEAEGKGAAHCVLTMH